MWEYSEKVQDHFFHPRNAGALAEANAVGEIGSIACGDALKLMLKVDPATQQILDARFQTFGCGSAIASSSALTEIIKGMTLDEALKVSNQDIATYLDGLPPEKMHCSVMGREALQAAVANYRGEAVAEDHEEGGLVCHCFGIHAGLIEEVVQSNRLSTVEDVTNYTKAGGGCTSCHERIEEILDQIQARRSQHLEKPEVECPPAPRAPKWSEMTMPQRVRRVEAIIERIRPQLRADHGDIELVEIDGKAVYVSMLGACKGCAHESATLGGLQQKLIEEFGELVRVRIAKGTVAAAGARGVNNHG
ncbi:MAG: Fe-S cluster assembly protein NifU [Planctomycetaceae bacterium]|nr:Fe-S cluster assembly protein NifU [Planctomycetaceae bacterium]